MNKEEAMKILKDFHDKSALFSVRTALDTIFPELTESNDERIRKELIDAILGLWDNDALPMPLSVKRKDEWIAWLEKQCYTKKDVDDAYLKGICYTKHELEKQGEQKSVGEEIVEALRTEYEKGKADAFSLMQKEWSEEDEERIKNILSVLDVQVCWNGATGKKENPYQKEINWLKFLKDRAQPQPKQEWSEEDEIARKALINLVEMYYGGCIDKTEKKRLLNLLKSLRPQNTWKPSEEQMSTLNLIISDYYHACTKECDKKAIVLKSILEQLKQL